MIRQLVEGIVAIGLPATPPFPAVSPGDLVAASEAVLVSDPLDLILCLEQAWDNFSPSAGPARRNSWKAGRFHDIAAELYPRAPDAPRWDHLASSYVIENTRAVHILGRVVREYRVGEALGFPSAGTQRWLDATEALLSGAEATWLSPGSLRQDPEAVRRNAYWRLLGLDLAFGSEDNQVSRFDRSSIANTNFASLFEELLAGLWRAFNNDAQHDGILRTARDLQSALNSRRQGQSLDRTELTAATVLGWIQLTVAGDTPVVIDLEAQAASPADRLQLIGDRVGLPAHSRSAALFSISEPLSLLLQAIESAVLTPDTVSALYQPGPVSEAAWRVIEGWSALAGRDLRD